MTSRLERPLPCPYCGLANDGATGVGQDDMPSDGDIGLCIRCAGIQIYVGTPPTAVREPDREELEKLAGDLQIRRAQAAIHRLPPYDAFRQG